MRWAFTQLKGRQLTFCSTVAPQAVTWSLQRCEGLHGWAAALSAFCSDVHTNPASVPAGAAAVGDGAPLHPSTGCGRHHREAGSEHQAAVALRRSLHQGGRCENSALANAGKQMLTLLVVVVCMPPPLRLLQLKEWTPNRGWSSSLDHRRLSLR